jgi:hypothetical protein
LKETKAIKDALDKARREGRLTERLGVPLTDVPPPYSPPFPADISEAAFQAALIEQARSWGWKVAHFRKVRVQRKGGKTFWQTPVGADGAGWPDLVMVRNNRVILAELKVGKNTCTNEQISWLEAWEVVAAYAPKVSVFVWRPEDWSRICQALA